MPSKVKLEVEITRVDGPRSSLDDVVAALCLELDGYALDFDDSCYSLNVTDSGGYELGERV